MNLVASTLWHGERMGQLDTRQCLEEWLPSAGELHRIAVSDDERRPFVDPVHLLWMPLLSEINGWDFQPSDIGHSYIITGRMRADVAKSADCPAGHRSFVVSVIDRTPLLEACMAANPSTTAAALMDEAMPLWDMTRWCGTAEVGGFVYLTATAPESSLTVLLRHTRETTTVHYQEYSAPGWQQCIVGACPLRGSALSLLTRRTQGAMLLGDAASPGAG